MTCSLGVMRRGGAAAAFGFEALRLRELLGLLRQGLGKLLGLLAEPFCLRVDVLLPDGAIFLLLLDLGIGADPS